MSASRTSSEVALCCGCGCWGEMETVLRLTPPPIISKQAAVPQSRIHSPKIWARLGTRDNTAVGQQQAAFTGCFLTRNYSNGKVWWDLQTSGAEDLDEAVFNKNKCWPIETLDSAGEPVEHSSSPEICVQLVAVVQTRIKSKARMGISLLAKMRGRGRLHSGVELETPVSGTFFF